MREPLDPLGQVVDARLSNITEGALRYPCEEILRDLNSGDDVTLQTKLRRWLGVIDVASVVRELAGGYSRLNDEVATFRAKQTEQDGLINRQSHELGELKQLVLQLNSRLTFYEQSAPQLRKARSDYERMNIALAQTAIAQNGKKPEGKVP